MASARFFREVEKKRSTASPPPPPPPACNRCKQAPFERVDRKFDSCEFAP